MAYLGNSPAAGENNSFKILDSIASYTLTFNGSSASVVSLADDTITKNEHRFITGQRVTYTHGGGTQITGLTSGSVYYIVKNDQNSIKLAPTYSDAIASTNLINLSGLGSGSSHTLNVAFDGVNTKFKATYDNGTKAGITRAAQLQISINGVIQQPHDSVSPPSGFGYDLDSTIVFSTAPVSTDVFWGNLVANNFPTFDISDNDIDNFTGDASTTSFTLSKTPVNSQNILVTLDGVVQYPSDNDTTRSYTLSENVLTFDSAPGNGVLIQVRHIGFAGATSSEVTGFYGRTGNVALRHIDDVKVGDVESIGISTFTVSGVGTVTVGSGSTTLLVDGDARVTGILTVGNTSLTLDGVNNKITIGSDDTFIENGAIGIGTTNAENYALNVNGTTNISGNATISGSANVKSLDYAGISSSISDTAVDIFIYDTSKDSDGGAWRKRTQHTSWYNETLGTATRGSRREFPAVAVIVSESDTLTIYDGDDPDLPMWMVFNGGTATGWDGSTHLGTGTDNDVTSVSALNGIICAGTSVNKGIRRFEFLKDRSSFLRSTAGSSNAVSKRPISGRNTENDSFTSIDSTAIVNSVVNDVAMTVLPNAPIDDATGLPVPTIAVANQGGVSVIRDDGDIFDITSLDGSSSASKIDFTDDLKLIYANNPHYSTTVRDIPSSDVSLNQMYVGEYRYTSYDIVGGLNLIGDASAGAQGDVVPFPTTRFATRSTEGITIIDRLPSSPSNGMGADINSSYNTGWMHGNIKGAFLSDTDATNVSADTLNAVNAFDGTFATSTGWTADSDWSISGGVATCNGNNSGRFIYPTTDRWSIGSSVVVEVTVTAYTSGTLNVSYGTGAATSGTDMTATGTYRFVNNVSGNDVIYLRSESFIGSIDNVKIYYAEYDRSVNTKGLIPYGTITKSAVATGAELVAYSGWSSSNYLIQPYNSGLDFGTGDWCYMFWYNPNDAESGDVLFSRWSYNVNTSTAGRIGVYFNSGNLRFDTTDDAGSSYQGHAGSDGTQDSNTWHCGVILRRGNNAELWVDGVRYVNNALNSTSDGSYTNTSAVLEIGNSPNMGSADSGIQLALLRASASAPSAEQIRKIYEDEKVLFQENASCTLYGSSDAVTALAYDEVTEQLHVGTSSGRSDFQGLRRINNTTTAVTTAISAHDGFIVEQ